MKLFVVLVAFLAAQASARVVTEAGTPEDILYEIFDSEELFAFFETFSDLPHTSSNGFSGIAKNPEKCLPYIEPAYKAAVEVRSIVEKGRELGKKLKEGAEKCKALTKPEDKKKCFKELKKVAVSEGKLLKEAYLKVRPTIIDVMNKFDQCMAGETQDVAPTNAQNCLPHVQEAYETAVEVRKIVKQGRELGIKLKEGFKKCKAITKPEDKKKCFEDLKKLAATEFKQIKDAYLKIKPKILEVMDKFDKCMA